MTSKPSTIKIACEGADLADLDELFPFQGDLKESTPEDLERLIGELSSGYTLPMKIWKLPTGRFYKGKKWIIGGHQTQIGLKTMRDRGWKVPKLPIVYTICSSEEEAIDRVLQDISQFGTVKGEGLFRFAGKRMGADVLERRFKIPGINMPSFRAQFFPTQGKEVKFTTKPGSTEYEQQEFEKFDHQCPRCGFGWGQKK